jgi:hypothetical protein
VAAQLAPPEVHAGSAARFLSLAFGIGLLAGIALDVLTFLVARYGPQGADGAAWSFRGNGALIVPLGLGPAILAAGWTGFGRHGRGDAAWQAWCFGVVAIGALCVGASVVVLIVFGSPGQLVSAWLCFTPLALMLVAPAIALVVPVSRVSERARRSRVVDACAAVLFSMAVVGSFFAAELVLAPGA